MSEAGDVLLPTKCAHSLRCNTRHAYLSPELMEHYQTQPEAVRCDLCCCGYSMGKCSGRKTTDTLMHHSMRIHSGETKSFRHMSQMDRRAFTLQPLIAQGILHPGDNRLSCAVGGIDYYADLGPGGEIIFEGQQFKSPSAFSVHVKRKQNPGRKADDGWTSVKYHRGSFAELLATFRPELERISNGLDSVESPVKSAGTSQARSARSRPRRARAKPSYQEESVSDEQEDGSDGEVGNEGNYQRDWQMMAGAQSHALYNDDMKLEYEEPQHLQNDQVDSLLDEEFRRRHLASHHRPALDDCTEEEFEADLCDFLRQRQEPALAKAVAEHRITCNNTPLDMFGLYREVIKCGGLLCNERYDESNRWCGSINFAGSIFPNMRNYTPNHKATSIGNQLLSNYRKFLYEYEKCYAPRDLQGMTLEEGGHNPSALDFLADVANSAGNHVAGETSRGTAAAAMSAGTQPINGILKGERTQRRRSTRTGKRTQPEVAAPSVSDEPFKRGDRKRVRIGIVNSQSGQQVIAALRKLEGLPGRPPPGTLLLSQDPRSLNRHWPVIVGSVDSLPQSVAAGGSLHCGGDNAFPLRLGEASSSGRADLALPVMALGTQSLGWVEQAACRPYTPSAADSALVSVMPEVAAGGYCPGEDSASHAVCARALKLAAQYQNTNDVQQVFASSMVEGAGAYHVAKRLCDLEGRLPIDSVMSNSFQFWTTWRRQLCRLDSASELTPQVLTLAHQLDPSILRRGVSAGLWDDLRHLLDMLPQGDADGDPRLGLITNQRGPSILAADAAVTAVEDAIDWRRLKVLWSPSRGLPPNRPPSTSPGPVGSSPDSAGRQSQSARGAVAGGPAGAAATSPSQLPLQAEEMANAPDGFQTGTAPSQHSAPAMPSEAPVTSPHRQLPGAGGAPALPPDTDAAAVPGDGEAKENKVHNFFRVDNLSGAAKDAPSTGSAAHGPQRAATPPPSQDAPSQQHHQHGGKPESGSADKDGAVQSGIHQEADTGNSPMRS